jgi:hypothetical protein
MKKAEYAIVLYFDEETRLKLQSIITDVSQSTGNEYMLKNNIAPHVTVSYFR